MNNQITPTVEDKKWYQKPFGILILLLLFFPVGLYLMWKYSDWSSKTKWIVTGVFAVLVLIGSVIGGDSQSMDNVANDSRSESAAQLSEQSYVTESDTTERTIELKVLEMLGPKTNMGDARMITVKIDDGEVWLNYMADENLTTNLTRFGILGDITDILEELPESLPADVTGIVFQPHLMLVDQYGNEGVSKVALITVKRNTWEQINWDNFLTDNLPNIADTYWEHPVLKS